MRATGLAPLPVIFSVTLVGELNWSESKLSVALGQGFCTHGYQGLEGLEGLEEPLQPQEIGWVKNARRVPKAATPTTTTTSGAIVFLFIEL